MYFQITNNLRYLLKKRIDKFNTRKNEKFFTHLTYFWQFIDSQPTYLGIIESLITKYPDLDQDIERILRGEALVGNSEEYSAAMGYAILRKLSDQDIFDSKFSQIAQSYFDYSNEDNYPARIRDIFLMPLHDYLDEQLDNPRIVLNLLTRYKQRCEWFYRDNLIELIRSNTRKSEKLLALNLYSYLHDQGLDFTIEPSSIYGEIDLIASQGTDDPLLADAKIFDANGRGKSYIHKAFNQIYTYTQQFNEPFGYLIIFKVVENDLCFSLSNNSSRVPAINFNNKTIFFIVIDIFEYPKPVSQRNPLKVITISEEDLIKKI
jgi:hypothetical protein